jgi:G3E family GTPase
MDDPHTPRAQVTVVSGFSPRAGNAVAHLLLTAEPEAVLVSHDLTRVATGAVRRVVRTGTTVLEDETVNLVHGCLSCTLREDVLPTLVRLARQAPQRPIVLLLHEVVEPEAVADTARHCLVDTDPVERWLRFDSFVTVVSAGTFLDDLAGTDDLADRGMQAAAEDTRSVADVLVRQIEFADTVVLWAEDGNEPFELMRIRRLLRRLAPWAAHADLGPGATADAADLLNTGRHQPELPTTVARGLEGYALGEHDPIGEHGVQSVVFRARRPMHPQRLYDALEELTDQALRSRGHIWLATQPDMVLAWESAGGGVALGSLGRWLAATDPPAWEQASDSRRLYADLEWDPYYGDRGNHLAFIGLGLDPAELHRVLASCLLTDEEIALGEDLAVTDPFSDSFTLTTAESE